MISIPLARPCRDGLGENQQIKDHPCLWFDDQAEEAAVLYRYFSEFKNLKHFPLRRSGT